MDSDNCLPEPIYFLLCGCKYMNFYLSLFSNIRFFQTMGAKEDSAPPPKPRRASENSSLRANFRDFSYL